MEFGFEPNEPVLILYPDDENLDDKEANVIELPKNPKSPDAQYRIETTEGYQTWIDPECLISLIR